MNTTPVTRWLLEKSPGIVRKLERMASNIVLLGESEKLNLKKAMFLVPQGIEVYKIISEYRYDGEIVFALKGEQDITQAYASSIKTHKEGGLNYMHGMGTLLDYPWFSVHDTNSIFDRLTRLPGKVPTWNVTPAEGKHPLLK